MLVLKTSMFQSDSQFIFILFRQLFDPELDVEPDHHESGLRKGPEPDLEL